MLKKVLLLTSLILLSNNLLANNKYISVFPDNESNSNNHKQDNLNLELKPELLSIINQHINDKDELTTYKNELSSLSKVYNTELNYFTLQDKISQEDFLSAKKLIENYKNELSLLNEYYKETSEKHIDISELEKNKMNLNLKDLNAKIIKSEYHTNSHIVQEGDTLYSISKKHNIDFHKFKIEILKRNNLKEDTINVGSIIYIPSFKINPISNFIIENTKNKPLGTKNYTIQKGDTLYSISKEYDISLTKLSKLNNLHTNSIKEGETIKLFNKPIPKNKPISTINKVDSNSKKTVSDIYKLFNNVDLSKFKTAASIKEPIKNIKFFKKPADLTMSNSNFKEMIINYLSGNSINLSKERANHLFKVISDNSKFWFPKTWKSNTLIQFGQMQTETSFKDFTRKNKREHSEGALQIEIKTAKYIIKKAKQLSKHDDRYVFINEAFSNKTDKELMIMLKDDRYNLFFSFAYKDILTKRFKYLFSKKINQKKYIEHIDNFIENKIKDKNAKKYIKIPEVLKDISKHHYPFISQHNGGIKNNRYVGDVLAVSSNIIYQHFSKKEKKEKKKL